MFIYTIKAQNIKFFASLLFASCAIIAAISLIPKGSDHIYPEDYLPAVKSLSSKDLKNISSNDDRRALLAKYGWETSAEPCEIAEVVIPEKFDGVYLKYNQLQQTEGFDLSKYKGKCVKKYSYIIPNYDYEGTVLANLLIYKDRVIGGDICTSSLDGFVKGLTKGNSYLF